MTPLERMALAMAVCEMRRNGMSEAICEAAYIHPETIPVAMENYGPQARAALMAIREPSDDMLKAAFLEMNKTPGRTWKDMKANNRTPREIFDAKERPRWTAMIDHVLKEGEG